MNLGNIYFSDTDYVVRSTSVHGEFDRLDYYHKDLVDYNIINIFIKLMEERPIEFKKSMIRYEYNKLSENISDIFINDYLFTPFKILLNNRFALYLRGLQNVTNTPQDIQTDVTNITEFINTIRQYDNLFSESNLAFTYLTMIFLKITLLTPPTSKQNLNMNNFNQ